MCSQLVGLVQAIFLDSTGQGSSKTSRLFSTGREGARRLDMAPDEVDLSENPEEEETRSGSQMYMDSAAPRR